MQRTDHTTTARAGLQHASVVDAGQQGEDERGIGRAKAPRLAPVQLIEQDWGGEGLQNTVGQ